ncbi:unnamed protein product, partial [Symbiodinium microadriaticum]
MGRQGYKGIASITNSVYVINDDGDHVIKIVELCGKKSCIVKVIAGQPGIEGNIDAEIGTNALLSRPGRIQADMERRICYFGDRRNKGVRTVRLEGRFPVSSLNVDFNHLAPEADLDFNRIVLSPHGLSMILLDRKGPHVFVLTELHSDSPQVRVVFDNTCGMLPPLQAAAWPVCSSLGHNCWDMCGNQVANGRLTLLPGSVEKGLSVSLGCCFFGTGSSVWLGAVPPVDGATPCGETDECSDSPVASTSESGGGGQLYHVADLSIIHNKFLVHDIISISSNTILVLNRHSHNTGIWQVSSGCNWAECAPAAVVDKKTGEGNFSKATRMALWLGDASRGPVSSAQSVDGGLVATFVGGHKSWKGPHGMALSPDRRSLLVVDTGEEPDGKRSGMICRMRLALDAAGRIRMRGLKVLEQMSPAHADWNPLLDGQEMGEDCPYEFI